MPDMSGIDFLNTWKYNHKLLFFVQRKYALDAFEYDVTDYLLKQLLTLAFIKQLTKHLHGLNEINKPDW